MSIFTIRVPKDKTKKSFYCQSPFSLQMFEENVFLSCPDCEEWSECTMSEKFCWKFVRHHTGPVFQEEALSGKIVLTSSDSSHFHFPYMIWRALTVILYYAWAFILLRRTDKCSRKCAARLLLFFSISTKVRKRISVFEALHYSLWMVVLLELPSIQAVEAAQLSPLICCPLSCSIISKTKSTEQRIIMPSDQDYIFSKW